ncbi:MAG: recombination protein RecR [Candidatus Andersenbacteria bacterium]|nr:recombination protein RecR [Candidatus Andersenbacteria bacterium]
MLPKAVRQLAAELNRWPGIGPKTAQRLALHLLRQPRMVVSTVAEILKSLHANVRICTECYNLAEQEQCSICREPTRQRDVLCVVESPLDIEAIEQASTFGGRYHVLGGVLSPLEGIDAQQLTLAELFARVQRLEVSELIIALNPTVEGEATARYIVHGLRDHAITISRLGRGLPTGGDIEFADAATLAAAFSGRTSV